MIFWCGSCCVKINICTAADADAPNSCLFIVYLLLINNKIAAGTTVDATADATASADTAAAAAVCRPQPATRWIVVWVINYILNRVFEVFHAGLLLCLVSLITFCFCLQLLVCKS